jgi:phosphotransferase system HPr (HPr) family protein
MAARGRLTVEETTDNSATRKVLIRNPSGLHARPSLAVSRIARESKSRVEVRTPYQKVDARDVLQLLSLGAACGTELQLTAVGPDADDVLDKLVAQFNDGFSLCDGDT